MPYRIDAELKPSTAELPGREHGPRSIAVVEDERGIRADTQRYRACVNREIDARSDLLILGDDQSGVNVAVKWRRAAGCSTMRSPRSVEARSATQRTTSMT